MKFKIVIFFCLQLMLYSGCTTFLNQKTAEKSFYINQIIIPNSKLSIHLENQSGFDMDVQNFSKDSLTLKREPLNSQFIVNKKISVKVAPNSNAELINESKNNIKLSLRIYHHNSKIIHKTESLHK